MRRSAGRRLRSRIFDCRAWTLSFKLHMRIGERDLLLTYAGHIVFTTVAGQGWFGGADRPLLMRRRETDDMTKPRTEIDRR